jgi:hypothetical protein
MTFARVSAVRPVDGGFAMEIDPRWTIGGKPNGGYLLASMARAASAMHPQHPDPMSASAVYLAAPDPGPAELTVTTLRSGRSADQARVQLRQGGQACVEALVTLCRLGEGQPAFSAVPLVDVAAWADCVPIPPVGPGGAPIAIFGEVAARIDPADLGFAAGPDGNHRLRGWLTLPGHEPDPLSLLYAVDAFPPATFGLGSAGWVPTLELSAYVRARPAPGPLRVLQEVGLVDGARVDERCLIWDSAGRLVAQATQLAGVRFGPAGVVRR